MRITSARRVTITARELPTSVCTLTATSNNLRSSSGTRLSMSSIARVKRQAQADLLEHGAELAAERVGELAHHHLQGAQQRMAGFERRFDEVERERQLGAESLEPAVLAKPDIKDRHGRESGADYECDQRIARERLAGGASGAEQQHHDEDRVGDPHVQTCLPEALFELAHQVETAHQGCGEFALFGFPPAGRYVVVIFVGARHPAQHFLGLVGLGAAAAGHHDQKDDEDCAEDSARDYEDPLDYPLVAYSVALWNICESSRKPAASIRCAYTERIPVARYLPTTLPVVVDPAAHELEQVLHHHHVAFHSADLGNLHAFARPVAESRLTCTMMLSAEAICWRIARCGIE